MAKPTKKRTNIYLSNAQWNKLQKLSDKTDLSASGHIRRAIDQYLERVDKEKKGAKG
jgi:predicted transcriptional regulator